MLTFGDLKDKTESEIKEHIASVFSNDEDQYEKIKKEIEPFEILVAYEFEDSYDGTNYFLLRDKNNNYYEIHGDHCSCSGYEDQYELQATNLEAILKRPSWPLYEDDNKVIIAFLKTLTAQP